MSHDDDNPFRRLAREFAERRRNASVDQAGATPLSKEWTPRPSRKQRRGEAAHEASAEDKADAALFLEAVRRIKPLPRKGGGRSHHNDAFAVSLAAKMREARDGPAFPSDSKRASPLDGPGAPDSGEASALPEGHELSFAAMLESLERRQNEAIMSAKEEALFNKAMQGVAPLTNRGREIAAPVGRAARPQAVDPAKALRDVLEGRVEFALHHTDEYMEGFVVGVDPLVLAKLRGGQYSPEKHVDLHGMNARQAYDALVLFIKNAYQRGLRTVIVVTGRGRNSPDGVGVLRPMLQRWLCREPLKRVVLAFCTARPGDGGLGAVYVLLRKYKKSRGKIIWEFTPSDDDFPDL